MLTSPANRNYHSVMTDIIIKVFSSNISTNDYTTFNGSTSKQRISLPWYDLRRDTYWTVFGISFSGNGLIHKGGDSPVTLHDLNPDTLWVVGFGFVWFSAPKAQLPLFPKTQQTPRVLIKIPTSLKLPLMSFPYKQ